MFISKLTKQPVNEGQGVFPDNAPYPWLGEPAHALCAGFEFVKNETVKNFIRKLKNYEILILNKGQTNKEIIAQFVLGTLTQKHIKRLRFVPVERIKKC